jgi:hypothetical protein
MSRGRNIYQEYLERMRKEEVVNYFKHYPSIYLSRLKKSTKALGLDSLSLGKYSNLRPP